MQIPSQTRNSSDDDRAVALNHVHCTNIPGPFLGVHLPRLRAASGGRAGGQRGSRRTLRTLFLTKAERCCRAAAAAYCLCILSTAPRGDLPITSSISPSAPCSPPCAGQASRTSGSPLTWAHRLQCSVSVSRVRSHATGTRTPERQEAPPVSRPGNQGCLRRIAAPGARGASGPRQPESHHASASGSLHRTRTARSSAAAPPSPVATPGHSLCGCLSRCVSASDLQVAAQRWERFWTTQAAARRP